jgi:hypothetical protein
VPLRAEACRRETLKLDTFLSGLGYHSVLLELDVQQLTIELATLLKKLLFLQRQLAESAEMVLGHDLHCTHRSELLQKSWSACVVLERICELVRPTVRARRPWR